MRLQLFLTRRQWPNYWKKCILMSRSWSPLRLEIPDAAHPRHRLRIKRRPTKPAIHAHCFVVSQRAKIDGKFPRSQFQSDFRMADKPSEPLCPPRHAMRHMEEEIVDSADAKVNSTKCS